MQRRRKYRGFSFPFPLRRGVEGSVNQDALVFPAINQNRFIRAKKQKLQ